MKTHIVCLFVSTKHGKSPWFLHCHLHTGYLREWRCILKEIHSAQFAPILLRDQWLAQRASALFSASSYSYRSNHRLKTPIPFHCLRWAAKSSPRARQSPPTGFVPPFSCPGDKCRPSSRQLATNKAPNPATAKWPGRYPSDSPRKTAATRDRQSPSRTPFDGVSTDWLRWIPPGNERFNSNKQR